jgi:hypothetical protein
MFDSEPQVELALMRNAEATEGGRVWRLAASSLGVPSKLEAGVAPTLTLPPQIVEGLGAALAKEPETRPLWLRFAKPHCYLGVQPWERELGYTLARPVLRLPDLLERSRENHEVLEVAVVFDPGPNISVEKAVAEIKSVAASLAQSSPRLQTRVNLFPSAPWIEQLRTVPFPRQIQLHDPNAAPTVAEAKERKAGPWSLWIADSLGNRSLDAIHFVSRAEATDTGPALLISSSPSTNEQTPVLFAADAEEIGALMTRTGAWAALFSPPPDEAGGAAMALTADALAHARPVSALFHPMLTPDHALAFQKACAFLFSPRPINAPRLIDGFVYCQPAIVADYADFYVSPVLAATQSNAALIEKAAPWRDWLRAKITPYIPYVKDFELKQAPNWATAVQRHVETVALEELRRTSPDVLLSSSDSVRAQLDHATRGENGAVEETLEEIQKVVRDYMQNSKE